MAGLAVVALGGDTILRPMQQGAADEQVENLAGTCQLLARLAAEGWRLVLTHGNGPQVGNLLVQNSHARWLVPPMPLDACGAQTQGLIGYWLANAMENALAAAGLSQPVACVVTRVLVDDSDPSFLAPAKEIGPLYTDSKAQDLMRLGIAMREVDRGWRQVVPSPRPLQVLEAPLIGYLVTQGYVVVAAGGGGVPVVRDGDGRLQGVEAVVEKDLTASRLAADLGADLLVLLTHVPQVVVQEPGDEARPVRELPADVALRLAAGYLPRASMGVKVEAAAQFAGSTGRPAIITNRSHLWAALAGEGGTRIVPPSA